ncbi:MAG TPA: hypothetical protein VFI45_22375 [Candidatus Acidoferrum sp.]|nr:hypothetical protein [Candidatus Acidoferrum sp.]
MGRPAPDFSNQVHDFDPGLDNGLFWTLPVNNNSVKVDPGSGRASLIVNDLDMEDYFNIVNALTDGSSNEAAVSFAVQWATGMKHFKVRDEATGMAGEFIRNTATMAWSVESAGQTYVSGPAETSSSVSAQIGHERNGVFFPQ